MSSISVQYNAVEISKIVIENVLRMLERRKNIDSWENEFKKFNDFNNKLTFDIVLKDKSSCSINMISTKLSSIVQGTPLDDYLSNNLEIHKILIVKDITKKVIKQLLNDYKNVEFFFETEMMEDLPDKDFIPEHEIIDKEERDEILLDKTENELSRILITDMMVRYYGAKIGDIMRITRVNGIDYRRVVNGSWDILFEE